MDSFLRTDSVCKAKGGYFHVGHMGSFSWVTVLFKVKVMSLHIPPCWTNELCKVKVHLLRVWCMS